MRKNSRSKSANRNSTNMRQPKPFTPNLCLGKSTRTSRTLTCTLQETHTGGGIRMFQKVNVKIWVVE